MDSLLKVSAVLMLCEISHAKGLLTNIQGKDAVIYIEALQTDVNAVMEIHFSGYTSNRLFTNVLTYHQKKEKEEILSINSNYTGRIRGFIMNNASVSFLLLNANFNDSGKYTVTETYLEKGNTGVLVARHILRAHIGERMKITFNIPDTNTSFIKIDYAIYTFNRTVLFLNVSKDVCSYNDVRIVEEMKFQNCSMKRREFSFTFPEISWLHKGSYFAWDEKGRLLDSLFVDIDENNTPTQASSYTLNAAETGLLISALQIVLTLTFLVFIAVRKHRKLRVQTTTTHKLEYKNGNPTVSNSSRNGCQKLEAKVRMNDRNNYSKGLDCSMSTFKPASKLQSNPKLLLPQTVAGDDLVHEYDELKTVSLTDRISKESCLRSNMLCYKATGITTGSSNEYDYVIKHTFMTLRPPAPDPTVTKTNKQQAKYEKFLYSFKSINIKPLSRVLPAPLYTRLEKRRTKKTQPTGSSVESKSLDLANELSTPCSFELKNDFTKKTIETSPKNGKRQ
ncbi:hypothetical protein CHS0354_042404 [Potamilus streckersoni]|uniref:Uncharacterized protein n=1 Tax=Potamilus streckersoni TaxID=2493646 RepID=A0AAE0W1J3_9BIVA|nr:hypothetical protein CHS0354_042404 [Potamilus streckersoni]